MKSTKNPKKVQNYNEVLQRRKRAAELILSIAEIGYKHLIPRWYSVPWWKKKNELDVFIFYGVIILIIFSGIRTCLNRVTKVKTKAE